MHTSVAAFLSQIKFGDPVEFENLTIIPLQKENGYAPDFLVLQESINQNLLTISEISESGSVPTLLVENKSDKPVIIFEGEELIGLKQNRILNATVIISKKTVTKIPVSCCEAGRWSYQRRGPRFFEDDFPMSDELDNSSSENNLQSKKKEDTKPIESETFAPPRLRSLKNESININLVESHSYLSDQWAVWNSISDYHKKAGSSSPTEAIQDAFKAKKNNVKDYEKHFPIVENQCGLLGLINGKVVGFDAFCSKELYAKQHKKLIRGYALDAILHKTQKQDSPAIETAKKFLESIFDCKEVFHNQTGSGIDYRYDSDKITGFALVYEDKVIHTAFLPKKFSIDIE
ncbi:MAG: hypothetical protein N2517_07940 [Ignavibacteria bacterium]|nr:hypothetical protein [Ignavibacteria bacterium]